jgi:WD40 repeat protein
MPKEEPNLLAIIKRPSNLKTRSLDAVQFCFDASQSELLVSWQNRAGDPPEIYRYSPPWSAPSEIIRLPVPGIANPIISKSGKWLALSDAEGLKLIHWHQGRRFVDLKIKDFTPQAFSRDEQLLLCRGISGFKILSLDSFQVIKDISSAKWETWDTFHPSNEWLMGIASTKLAVYNLKTDKRDKELFIGGKLDLSAQLEACITERVARGANETELRNAGLASIRSVLQVFGMEFNSDGSLMLCGTSRGLRVYDWKQILKVSDITPKPLVKTLPPVNPEEPETMWVNGLALDEKANRLLFCDGDGTVQFLDLTTNQIGVLLRPSKSIRIDRLELSLGRKILCTFSEQGSEGVSNPLFRIWDYTSICKGVGLE